MADEEKKEPLSLINKIVKVKDSSNGIDNTGIIPFMYPDFIVKDELFFDYDNSVIINAKYSPNLKSELQHGTKKFIALCDSGMQDIDFTNREIILQVLKDRHKGRFSKEKMSVMLDMSEFEFWQNFKRYWVVNLKQEKEDEVSFLDLYNVLGGKTYEIFNVYFKLRQEYSDSTIYSTVLGFIDKSFHPEKVASQSGSYLKSLRLFRKNFGYQAQIALEECYRMKCESDLDKQYRTMFLLKSLGRGNVI